MCLCVCVTCIKSRSTSWTTQCRRIVIQGGQRDGERSRDRGRSESINQWVDVGRVTALDTGVGPGEKRSRHIMLSPSRALLVPLQAS